MRAFGVRPSCVGPLRGHEQHGAPRRRRSATTSRRCARRPHGRPASASPASRASSRGGPRPARRGASCRSACPPRRRRARRSATIWPSKRSSSHARGALLATRGRTRRCRRGVMPHFVGDALGALELRRHLVAGEVRLRDRAAEAEASRRLSTRSACGSSPRRRTRWRRRPRPSRPATRPGWWPAATTRTACRRWSPAPTAAGRPTSHAVRAMLKPCSPTLLTQPPTTWPTSAGIDAGSLDERRLHRGQQVGGMDARQATATAADGSADCFDDHDFGHAIERTGGCRRRPRPPSATRYRRRPIPVIAPRTRSRSDRADERHEDGAPAEVGDALAAERGEEEAAEEASEHADHHREQAPRRSSISRRDPREPARDQPDDDPAEYAHGRTIPTGARRVIS